MRILFPKLMLGMFCSVSFTLNWKRRNKFNKLHIFVTWSHILKLSKLLSFGQYFEIVLCILEFVNLFKMLSYATCTLYSICSHPLFMSVIWTGIIRLIHITVSKIKLRKIYLSTENRISGNIWNIKVSRTPGENGKLR